MKIIKSICETTTNSLIYKDSISKTFSSNIGVKRDTLSTILFNLYINDIPKSPHSENNNPININDTTKLSCLKYADDLILVSTSKDGLQNRFKCLQSYCTKWKLEINMKKIKKHNFIYKQKKRKLFYSTDKDH